MTTRGRLADAGVRAGEVFFAVDAGYVHLIAARWRGHHLNSRNLIAFDASLDSDIKRTKGAGHGLGGLFNTAVIGHRHGRAERVGQPVVLDCSQQPTYVDTQAAVCLVDRLVPGIDNAMNMKSMLRGGSGEAFQYAFHGPGFVVVQASSGAPAVRGRAPAAAAASATSSAADLGCVRFPSSDVPAWSIGCQNHSQTSLDGRRSSQLVQALSVADPASSAGAAGSPPHDGRRHGSGGTSRSRARGHDPLPPRSAGRPGGSRRLGRGRPRADPRRDGRRRRTPRPRRA